MLFIFLSPCVSVCAVFVVCTFPLVLLLCAGLPGLPGVLPAACCLPGLPATGLTLQTGSPLVVLRSGPVLQPAHRANRVVTREAAPSRPAKPRVAANRFDFQQVFSICPQLSPLEDCFFTCGS